MMGEVSQHSLETRETWSAGGDVDHAGGSHGDARRLSITAQTGLLESWPRRLANEIPGTLAVLLKGSYARGDAGHGSDVDFDVLVDDTTIVDPYLTWLDDSTDTLVHVSVAVKHLDNWLAQFREPAAWGLGFPARVVTRLVWAATPLLAAELDRPWWEYPAGEPELEDFVESLGKARRAVIRGDDLAARLALQELGRLCPSLLIPLSGEQHPATRPEALAMALDLDVVPPDYRTDMLALLGLDEKAHTVPNLLATGEQLALGVIDLLETHLDLIVPLLAPHLDQYLVNGSLRRYLLQTQ